MNMKIDEGGVNLVRGETQIEDMQARHVLEKQFVQPLKGTLPDVLNRKTFELGNTEATTITDFKNGAPGQRIYLLGDGFSTIEHGTLIFTSTGANKLLEEDKVYTFTFFKDGLNSHKWVEDADNSGGGGGGGSIVTAQTRKSDTGFTAVSATYTAVDTALDIVVPAVEGDVFLLFVNGLWNTGSSSPRLDIVTVVSSAFVNYISATGSGGAGVQSWRGLPTSVFVPIGGGILYTIVEDDIESGNVRFRLVAKSNAEPGNRQLIINVNEPLVVNCIKLGQ